MTAITAANILQRLNSTPYILQLQQIIDVARTLGYTLPTPQQLQAYNNFLKYLNSVGLLTRMKTGNIYGFGSIEFGTLNLANPLTYQHTSPDLSSVLYTPISGVKSAGSGNSYINTRWRSNEYSGIELDLTTIVSISESSTAFSVSKSVYGVRPLAASSATLNLLRPLTTASAGTRAHYAANDNFSNTDHRGLYINTYNGTQAVLYKDYTLTTGIRDTQVVTPTAPDLANFELLLARNSSGVNGGLTVAEFYDINTSCHFRFDRYSDQDAINFKTGWDQFRSDVGLLFLMDSTLVNWDSTDVTFDMI